MHDLTLYQIITDILFLIFLYRHVNVVTSTSEQSLYPRYIALYKYLLLSTITIINLAAVFGCLEWSPSEKHLLYVAEKKEPDTKSYFDKKAAGDATDVKKAVRVRRRFLKTLVHKISSELPS